jgi:hypothetical protein
VTGGLETHLADAVVLATGGYANAYYLSTNAKASNATAIWRAHRRGAAFANPGFVQFHPTCLPATGEGQAKTTLMSESLRNDGRLWVPVRAGDARPPQDILSQAHISWSSAISFRQSHAARPAPRVQDDAGDGRVGLERPSARDLTAVRRLAVLRERYGNLFECTSTSPANALLRRHAHRACQHYTIWLWVDYDLMSNQSPSLFAIRANFRSRRQSPGAGAPCRRWPTAFHPALHPGTSRGAVCPRWPRRPEAREALGGARAVKPARRRRRRTAELTGSRPVAWDLRARAGPRAQPGHRRSPPAGRLWMIS